MFQDRGYSTRNRHVKLIDIESYQASSSAFAAELKVRWKKVAAGRADEILEEMRLNDPEAPLGWFRNELHVTR